MHPGEVMYSLTRWEPRNCGNDLLAATEGPRNGWVSERKGT